ncbi:uncharacterized protein LOC127565639 [Drosophila albomicans]|uniref:Uncharacterized protein LOC127565639 n=1 Tax=Drosophila albomicans TaxID=7291 RepID=A0A9C6T426_DROAB|nr:uncharacterized protein LOC127565639 [Drosophila albomicans]
MLTNFVCQNNDETWFTFHECRLRAISSNKTILNLNGTFHQTVTEFHVRGQMFYKTNGYKPWLYNVQVECCRFMRKTYNPIAIIIYRFIKNYSNMNHTCPYKGAVIIKGLYLRFGALPNALPTGDYMLALTWSLDNKTKFTTNAYFMFAEDL